MTNTDATTTIAVTISLHSGLPAYEQIKEQIKALIMSGGLNAGEMLPSVRGFARDLKVSNITTIRAYSDLENEGLVTTVQGRGCFVNALPGEIVRKQYLDEIAANLTNVAVKGKAAGLTLKELKQKLEEKFNECD
ncbi:MAG: GntR family transcriptional regulator [Clostridiales Family XIII bacterium]|nr:GntR family transcriptional regulator [Clostridiales Family XIII bacterium]